MKKIYYNGYFLTMENFNVEAILVQDGLIKKIGTKDYILSLKDSNTTLINLKGKTMMPSFIDAHSHFSGVANNFLKADLQNCNNFKEIQNELINFKSQNNISDGLWISASGYDENQLKEKKHPMKEIIDEVLPNNPVILQHVSGHSGVFNSKALEILNITNDISTDNGVIEKNNGILTGYMEETPFIEYQKKVPSPTFDKLLFAYKRAQEKYLSYGITTIQDGMAYPNMISIYKELIKQNILNIDLVSYISPNDKEIFFNNFQENIRKYNNHFKIGGYKIFLDGSPQMKTAWMRTPYLGTNNYYGYPTMTNLDINNSIKISLETNMQLLAHCNGDAAVNQYIQCIKLYEDKLKNIRPVMIHAQLLGIDQIKYLKKYNIIPSFFISHVFYWGDTHIKNFGYERASQISPANSTLKSNILFTFHQDSPVIEPNMFETIWCAINRITKQGVTLGHNEKISIQDAIKAVTINSAYQYFEENSKGSINEGKIANLIIVDKNPFLIDVNDIKNIKVLETISNGLTLYKQ